MSILGVKKNVEKEILNMKSELRTMSTKDRDLHRSVAGLTIRVLNVENIVSNIENKPDRKIISINAGIDGPIKSNQKFNFGDGGGYYVMNFPGQILGIGVVSLRTNTDDIVIKMIVNGGPSGRGISLGGDAHSYYNFDVPVEVKAGDIIGFVNKSANSACINTLVSAVIELFL